VKDDRDYDWDKTDGHIVDPYGISAFEGGSSSASGGSGGCGVGAGGFAALLALAFAMKRGNKPE
jgi:hypothetical protein